MKFRIAFISTAISILVIYTMLIAAAFYYFEFSDFHHTLSDSRVNHAITISVIAASIATILAIIIAVPAAFALSRYNFRFKSVVDIMLEFPMIVSPAALGAIILIFFQTPLGLFIRENVIDVIYTFWGIVLAQFITVLGISTRLIKAVFDEIPIRYENIARTMGATPRKAFFNISFPLAKKGIISALVLTWAKAIGEFGATITIAGSMAMETETLPTAIFMKLSMADIKGTVTFIIILFTVSLLVLSITRLFLKQTND